MTNVATVPRGERDIIQQLVFGEKGLVNAEDTFHFEEISDNILATTANDKFKNYFVKLFKSRINLYVFRPRRNSVKGKLWINNNAESINNVLKLSVNWKPQNTPRPKRKTLQYR